eukprot:3061224-Rhodomonas_salina.1
MERASERERQRAREQERERARERERTTVPDAENAKKMQIRCGSDRESVDWTRIRIAEHNIHVGQV